MIQVTDGAKAELRKLLDASVDWPGARLRLLERSRGILGLGIDIEAEGDHVVEFEGDKLLLISDDLASRVGGILLDVDRTPDGMVLVIDEQ